MNKYKRELKGVEVDVYDVLLAFDVTCPAMQHAIKKCLAPGKRGVKSAKQDKKEAIKSIKRSIELTKLTKDGVIGNPNWRADKWEDYYYWRDGVVVRVVEAGWSIDSERYEAGNYYKTEEEAEACTS